MCFVLWVDFVEEGSCWIIVLCEFVVFVLVLSVIFYGGVVVVN